MPLSAVANVNTSWPIHAWSGTIQGRRLEGEDWVRLGSTTGSGSQTLLARAPDSSLTIIRVCTTKLEAGLAQDQAESWQRETLEITDDLGRRYRALIKTVTVAFKACKGVSAVSGAPAFGRVTVNLVIEALARV